MKETLVRPAGPEPRAVPPAGASWQPWLAEVIACLAVFAALGAFFLYRYPRQHLPYPVGWDSPYYVWRANSVAARGLEGIGAIRAASPLLLAMLVRATGQNALTMVAVLPAVLVGIVGLGAAVMVRTAFGVKARWVPFIAVMTWLAFGRIGMVGSHLDNVLNSAFVVSAFGAAVVLIGARRPSAIVRGVGVAVLLMAAALAEWPFYLIALAILGLALALFVWLPFGDGEREWPERFREAFPIAGGAAASVAFTGLTFLTIREAGGS